jgi:hypothetical protein
MQVVSLSPADWVFMLFVLITLFCLATRRDVLLPTSLGLIATGTVLTGSLLEGLQVTFRAFIASTTDLAPVIIISSLIIMMTKTMEDMGSDKLMVAPLRKMLSTPNVSCWVISFSMLFLTWFIWPTPAVALLGALVVPLAITKGLQPIIAAMALSIFGKGMGLSSDLIIQAAPAVTSKLTKIPIADVISANLFIWAAVSGVAAITTFIIAYKTNRKAVSQDVSSALNSAATAKIEAAATAQSQAGSIGRIMAWAIPLALLSDIVCIFYYELKGAAASSLIGGTVVALTMISAAFHYKGKAFEKVMDHARGGWTFAIRTFGPVVLIAGFFWLGSDSLKDIIGDRNAQGLMFNWGYFIAAHIPINTFMVAVMVTLAGFLAAFNGSSFAALPVGVSIAMAFGKPIGADVAVLASMAQMAAMWTATIVPWSTLAVVASMTGVDPQDLARRNLLPTILGLAAGVVVTTLLA